MEQKSMGHVTTIPDSDLVCRVHS